MWFWISEVRKSHLIIIISKLAGPQRSHFWLGEVWVGSASWG